MRRATTRGHTLMDVSPPPVLELAPPTIAGIGLDIFEIARLERAVARDGRPFLNTLFSDEEQRIGDDSAGTCRLGLYAKGFALKEACAKALGTGALTLDMWREIETVAAVAQGRGIVARGAAAAVAERVGVERWMWSAAATSGFVVAWAVALKGAASQTR